MGNAMSYGRIDCIFCNVAFYSEIVIITTLGLWQLTSLHLHFVSSLPCASDDLQKSNKSSRLATVNKFSVSRILLAVYTLLTSPIRPIAWESEDIMLIAPISCKMSSAAIVSPRMRDSAKDTSSGIFLSKWWQTIYYTNRERSELQLETQENQTNLTKSQQP